MLLTDALSLPGGNAGHGLDQHLDQEGLAQHRCRTEPIGLLDRLRVRGANDDRYRRVALLDSTYERSCEAALVSMKPREIGDDQVGGRVRWRALKTIDERELVALIAQHLAKEVADGAVVFDDQNLSYQRQAGAFGRSAQF